MNLVASPKTATMPDGSVLPMWGLSCNDGVSAGVTCAAANAGAGSAWSPVVIRVDSTVASSLTITLANNLSFSTGTGTNTVPTSLVILGQVGGGLGTSATYAASPSHSTQQTTWPVVANGATNTPVAQAPRVQSFANEVAAGSSGTYTFSNLRPGTYLIQSGTHPSIQVPMGLYGVLVVTAGPGQAYPSNANAAYDADLPLVFGEIDPLQNTTVDTAVRTAGFNELTPWSGLTGQCGDPTVHTCYPPAVNYSPRYYLVNGVSFDRTNIAASSASVLAPTSVGATVSSTTGKVLLRYVNAGLRMHVPAVVGLNASVIAEDGNVLPGNPRVQGEVLLPAGKTHDAIVSPAVSGGLYVPATYPIFDRQGSLTTNSQRDGGMQAYINIAGGAPAGKVGSVGGSQISLTGVSDKAYYCQAGTPLIVSNAAYGVLAGATGANGAVVASQAGLPAGSSLVFNANGTFTYNPPATGACAGSFTFSVNNAVTHTANIYECDASAQQNGCTLSGPPVLANDAYKSNNAVSIAVQKPGVLVNDTDPAGRVLQVDVSTVTVAPGAPMTVAMNADGSFSASATAPGTYTFTYNVRNSQKVAAATPATVSVTFPQGTGLQVHLVDQKHAGSWAEVTDYRWIIEEDRTYYSDPKCQVNNGTYNNTPINPTTGLAATDSFGQPCPNLPIESLGYNFYSGGMPTVATGCTGPISCGQGQTLLGQPAHCDIGSGICKTDNSVRASLTPDKVYLDPHKHYFISVMPGDGINPTINGGGAPVCSTALVGGVCTSSMRMFDVSLDCPNQSDFAAGTGKCGHEMSGAQITPQFRSDGTAITTPSLTINLQETPLPTAHISVLVYEDDWPLNGENDAGGGVDILATNEPGLADFQVVLLDQAAQLGDNVGQMTYDMFNQPLTNSLAGTIDPMNGNDACPITSNPDDLNGMIVTCPKYESDHVTLSPIAGQAVIANLPGGLYEVQAFPNADRIGRGEHWLQTNTLDGAKPHEAFIRPGEPAQFQEFGPGGFHCQIGFANPKIINDRRHNDAGTGLCDPAPSGGGLVCASTLNGHVHGNHMSRTPDERTYDTGTYDAFKWSTCYVSIGIPDEEDFAFTTCDADGNWQVTGMPTGTFKVAVFDEWNDIMLDGLVSSLTVSGQTQEVVLTATQWRTNLYTRAYLDANANGIPDRDAAGNDLEDGLALIPMVLRYRDGEVGFKLNTDANGYATWNEIFPIAAWMVLEPDYARYKSTGVHVVYDAGGPDDCSPAAVAAYGGTGHCSKTAAYLAGSTEFVSLPVELRVPGARYCQDADCSLASDSIQNGAYYNQVSGNSGPTTGLSSGRIDPPQSSEGFQGMLGQHQFVDFGFKPYAATENGGIKGIVAYASTRPFDDPTMLIQNNWEPGVANVTVNLYKKGLAADGTTTLTLVDTLQTESWDKSAQGFRTDGTGTGALVQSDGAGNLLTGGATSANAGAGYIPNMNCPGQFTSNGFFATLQGSKMWLDTPDAVTGKKHQLAYKSQFKCFDGWADLNQIQPASYDGHFSFPSVTDRNPVSGRPSATNCQTCIANPDDGNPMLPAGDYVVEVVPPQGYQIVKEEDKNILLGDGWIAPVTQQFAGFGAVFILPDQAAVSANYNAANAVDSTSNLGFTAFPRGAASVTGVQIWPCVGETRIVPDYISLFPGVHQTAPFAGATRALCDRKEVQLTNQMGANTAFYVFTEAHKAGRFYGVMSDDMASEFDPFSPAYGEKYGPPNLPVGMRDFSGNPVVRVYADQWGIYNGLFPSSWEVNPPDPSGYTPQMSIACMNDPGPILDQNVGSATFGQMITDPQYSQAYSNFCYEHPFLPGVTAHMDTPVTPVMAFADHYNLPDAEYPNNTPVIKRADFVGQVGPWSPSTVGVGSVTVGNRGANYTSAPSVAFTGGAGSGAIGQATMRVGSFNVTSAGTGYTGVPTVSVAGNATVGNVCVGPTTVTVPTGGSAIPWTSAVNPVIVFDGTPISRGNVARAFATVTAQKVTAITVQSGGCYTTLPTHAYVVAAAGSSTVGAPSGTVSNSGLISVSVATNGGGTGYTSQPNVSVSGGGGSGAAVSALLAVDTINVTSNGAGYTSVPTVSLTGGGGSGATAAANLGGGVATQNLVLQAFGDRTVQNPLYAGPNVSLAPYNQKTIVRHYGFGSQCTVANVDAGVAGCTTVSSVQILGPKCRTAADFGNLSKGCVTANIVSWTDSQITVSIPAGVPACALQQQSQGQSLCGEVAVVAGNGKQSFDGITVTIGGKAPTVVNSASPSRNAATFGDIMPTPIQTAIDNASPGDLIIIDAGTYRENLIMWKPVRLQGVGNGSVTINADSQPAGKIAPWRRQISCLFGLTTQGAPNPGNAVFSTNDKPVAGLYSCPNSMYFRADRLPYEGFVGWDTASNGNLMQLIIEPSLMGSYEYAGVTVVGRGVNQSGVPAASGDWWGQAQGGGEYAAGAKYLSTNGQGNTLLTTPWTSTECNAANVPTSVGSIGDYYTGNYDCNPSTIDGLTITNSSQGGGGVFIHGWGHNLQVANNRILANAGTLAGGINLGNGEVPPAFLLDNTTCGATGTVPVPLCPPYIINGAPTPLTGAPIPFGFNRSVRIHHNQIIDNASIGDALYSYVPSGSGGITTSGGSDYYTIDHNWIAANLTAGDGGGIEHMGYSENATIANNVVLFNESNNPTLEVDGGGIQVMGQQEDRVLPDGTECGGNQDSDCPPGLGFGTGHNLVIDSNLVLGNGAAYGSGGGIRLNQVNGAEISSFPHNPELWYSVTLTNNIIVNNVAGWDGGGVSIQDAMKTILANNTIASNDTTASAGVLFKTMGAVNGASPPPGCIPTSDPNLPASPTCANSGNAPHMPQPAGFVTMQNTPNLMASMVKYWDDSTGSWLQTGNIYCPAGFGYGTGDDSVNDPTLVNGRCTLVSIPKIVNTMFWQNRAFYVAIVNGAGQPIANQGSTTANGTGLYGQQNIVALLPTLNQTTTGQCLPPSSGTYVGNTAPELYWDVGVRLDTGGNSGHILNFNAATIGSSYTLDAVASATLANSASATFSDSIGQTTPTSATLGTATLASIGSGASASAVIGSNATIGTVTTGAVGSGATATSSASWAATASSGALSSGHPTATVTNVGSGYTTAPTVTFNGGTHGAGTTSATATLSGSAIASISYTGTATYTVAPTSVTISAPNNAGTLRSITVGNAGTGYTTAPTVTITGGGATTQATATANISGGTVTSISLNTNGAGYTSNPTVTLTSATGVTAIAVTNGGAGYTTAPTVTITGGGATTTAAATAVVSNGVVTQVNITSGGRGYTSTPTVTLGTSPAIGKVATILLNNGGTGYTVAPAVTLDAPQCVVGSPGCARIQATVTPVVSGGVITALNLTAAGSGYTAAPNVTITSSQGVGSVPVTAGGASYATAPTVSFNGGGGNGATATATIAGGLVTGITVTNPGSGYTSAPTVGLSGGGATGVTSLTVATGGTNYSVAPTLTLDAPGCTLNGTSCQQATATAAITGGKVSSVAITNAGAGYTAAPGVTLSNETFGAASVGSLQLLAGGSGFNNAPTVAIDPPPCTVNGTNCVQATGTATINRGIVTAVTLTNGGAGYTSVPYVAFQGGGLTPNLNVYAAVTGATYNNNTVTFTIPAQSAALATGAHVTVTGMNPATYNGNYTVTGSTTTTITAAIYHSAGTFVSGGTMTLPATSSGASNFSNNNSAIVVRAQNSIFTDAWNADFASPTGTPDATNVIPASAPLLGQYCNGARVPPEICTQNLGYVNPGMCAGYFTPAGQSEAPGVFPVFVFNNITATATTDEGNNWINMVYGPLSLTRVPGTPSAEGIVTASNVAAGAGVYTISATSAAVDAGQVASAYTDHDFFGNPRGVGAGWDIGAMELQPAAVNMNITKTAATTVTRGNNLVYTVQVQNLSATNVNGVQVTDTLTQPQFSSASWTCAASAGSACQTASGTGSITSAAGGTVNVAAGGTVTYTITAAIPVTVVTGPVTNTASFALPAGVTEGYGNTYASATTTIVAPVPVITSVTPSTAQIGATVNLALVGTGFYGASAVALNDGGNSVACSALVANTDTAATATCVIPATWSAGAGTVSITNSAGTGSAAFTFTQPAALIATVTPNTANRGNGSGAANSVNVAFTGSGLSGASAATIVVGATTINCTGVTASSQVAASATCAIPSNATVGSGTITVTATGGTSNTLPFSITAGTPTISAITPATVVRATGFGTSVRYTFTITGTYLTGTSAVSIATGGGAPIACTAVGANSDTSVTATCAFNSFISAASHVVTLTTVTANGQPVVAGSNPALTATTSVTVLANTTVGTPLVFTTGQVGTTNVTNALVRANGAGVTNHTANSVTLTISGGGFTGNSGAAVTLPNVTGVTCTNATVVNDTTITTVCSAASTATASTANHQVQVALAGGNVLSTNFSLTIQ